MEKKSNKKELEEGKPLSSFLLETQNGEEQYKGVYQEKGLIIGITAPFKMAILPEVPLSKTLNIFIEDPNSGLFKPAVLGEVFKLSKKTPFITGGQIITALVLQELSKELIVNIERIKDLSEPTGLHPKTISKNIKALQRELLFAQKRENGGMGFKGKILLTKQLNSSNSYKLSGEFFTTEKTVISDKGKKPKSIKISVSKTYLDFDKLRPFFSNLPSRSQDKAVYFFIYLAHIFTRKNATHTQHILLSELKGRIFFREVFHEHNVNKTITIFLEGLKTLGYVVHYNFTKNRSGKECILVSWKNSIAIQKGSSGEGT